MIILYFAGVLSLLFSILAIYPLFHKQDIILGIILVSSSLLFFYYFVMSSLNSNLESYRFKIVKTVYIFILNFIGQLAGLWAYSEIFSQIRELKFFTPVFKLLFSLFQIPAGWENGNLYLHGVSDYVHTFTPNNANFGMVYLMMAVFSFLPLLIIIKDHKQTGRYFLAAGISLFGFLFLRTTILVMLFLAQPVRESGSDYYMTYFWHSLYGFLSFLPWLIFTGVMFSKKRIEMLDFSAIFNKNSFKKHLFGSFCLGCSVFLLAATIFWVPSGKEKPGRILFEEYYSDWTKSTKAIDENWYGTLSTYNYFTFRKYISSFYEVTVNEQPLEQVDLAKYDILILKVPTKPYPEKVIRQLVNYVRNGGGVWVIGDHTNLYGSSTYLNRLIRYFGVRLRYDAVYHNETGKFNFIYTKNLIKHPIIQRVPFFLFATSCTLEVNNPLMRTVIPGETAKSYNISYSQKNFFPDTKPDLNIYYGSMRLLTAGNYGRGRVVVFTDSTVFSNFYIYLPGKTELALSVLNWLNHRQLPGVKLLLFLLTVITLAAFLRCYKKVNNNNGVRNLVWPTVFGTIFLLLTVLCINLYNIAFNKFPAEKAPLIKPGFLHKYSSIDLPYAVKLSDDRNNYNTFYTWGQRIGLCNRYYFDLKRAIKEGKALFMILPKRIFTPGDLTELDKYLRKGGRIFLFDDGGKGSSANQFLGRYGLAIQHHELGSGSIISSRQLDFKFPNILPVGSITGDCTVLYDWVPSSGTGLPVLVRKKVEKGELYVFGGIRNFSNAGFGPDNIVPEGDKKQINDLILEIYKLAAK